MSYQVILVDVAFGSEHALDHELVFVFIVQVV